MHTPRHICTHASKQKLTVRLHDDGADDQFSTPFGRLLEMDGVKDILFAEKGHAQNFKQKLKGFV